MSDHDRDDPFADPPGKGSRPDPFAHLDGGEKKDRDPFEHLDATNAPPDPFGRDDPSTDRMVGAGRTPEPGQAAVEPADGGPHDEAPEALEHDREALRQRIEQLTADRNERIVERDEAAARAEDLRKQHGVRVKAESLRLRKRRVFIAAGISLVVLLGFGIYVFSTRVTEETLTGHVVATTGTAPAVEGEACRVSVEAAYFPFNTWLQVDCGTQRLYGHGSYGHVQCDTEEGAVTRCEDSGPIGHDGDPHIVLDRPAGRVVLDDGSRWRIEIAVGEPTSTDGSRAAAP